MKNIWKVVIMVLGIPLGAKGAAAGGSQESNCFKAEGGDLVVVGVAHVKPSQLGFSSLNVEEKVDKISKGKGGRRIDGEGVFWKKNGLPVMQCGDDCYVIDGHHDWAAAVQMGATSVAVNIQEEVEDIEAVLKRNSASMPADIHQLRFYLWGLARDGSFIWKDPLKDFEALLAPSNDDLGRTFFALTKIKKEPGEKDERPKGGAYALWVKHTHRVPPFAEFMLGHAAYALGLRIVKGSHLDESFVARAHEKFRKLLGGEIEVPDMHPFTWSGFWENFSSWFELAPALQGNNKRSRRK